MKKVLIMITAYACLPFISLYMWIFHPKLCIQEVKRMLDKGDK